MKIFKNGDTVPRPANVNSFVGPAMTRLLATSDEGASVHVYRVEFGDGARTNWHRHSGAQWLFVIEGDIRIQRDGEPAADASDGDAIVIPPGEKHWHGATPGSRGVHIAVNIDATTEWLEAVTDAHYYGR